jgi:hypothetical protein
MNLYKHYNIKNGIIDQAKGKLPLPIKLILNFKKLILKYPL